MGRDADIVIDFTEHMMELEDLFGQEFSKANTQEAIEYMALALVSWIDWLSAGPGKGSLKKYLKDVDALRNAVMAMEDLSFAMIMATAQGSKKKWASAKKQFTTFSKKIEYGF